MRSKEEAHDYRYFPDPDLLPVAIDEAFVAAAREALPELPQAKRERFVASYGLDRKSTRLNSSHVAISYAVFCLKKKTIRKAAAGLARYIVKDSDEAQQRGVVMA